MRVALTDSTGCAPEPDFTEGMRLCRYGSGKSKIAGRCGLTPRDIPSAEDPSERGVGGSHRERGGEAEFGGSGQPGGGFWKRFQGFLGGFIAQARVLLWTCGCEDGEIGGGLEPQAGETTELWYEIAAPVSVWEWTS